MNRLDKSLGPLINAAALLELFLLKLNPLYSRVIPETPYYFII
jgi:hypothetical protein